MKAIISSYNEANLFAVRLNQPVDVLTIFTIREPAIGRLLLFSFTFLGQIITNLGLSIGECLGNALPLLINSRGNALSILELLGTKKDDGLQQSR